MTPLDIGAVAAVVLLIMGWRTGVGRRARNLAQQKITRLLHRAENPVDALDLSYQKQREALLTVRRGIAEVVTSQKRLEIQAAQLRQSQDRLQGQARTALQQGREDLARLALTRSQTASAQIDSLQEQIVHLRDQEQKLELTSQKLQARVESFKTQRDTLKAQYSAAQASARIGETVTGISGEMRDVGMMLERAQDKTQQMQARASAIDQLISSGTLDTLGAPGEDDIDRQLRAGVTEVAVDAQLTRLRQELLADTPAQPRIGPAGQSEVNSEQGD
ncbi:MAG TPA: PspA/IM30 family protein [Candidatus Dormibacteraeota bacterium]|nr:PspA/IM30 family protein [Candidatus Dormibacteraeota bacterium]